MFRKVLLLNLIQNLHFQDGIILYQSNIYPPKDVDIKLILLSAIKPTVSQKDQWKIAFPIQPLSANFTEMIFDRFAFDGWDFNVKLKKTSNTQVSFYLEGFHQEGKKTCENKITNLFIKNRS